MATDFVLGVIARCQPVYQRVSASRPRLGLGRERGRGRTDHGHGVLQAAGALPGALDSSFKRNLAGARVANFLAIAWVATNLARYDIVRKIATRVSWIGAVGRDGMVCFVASAVISLTVDSNFSR